jgi:hypothetical protein
MAESEGKSKSMDWIVAMVGACFNVFCGVETLKAAVKRVKSVKKIKTESGEPLPLVASLAIRNSQLTSVKRKTNGAWGRRLLG